MALGLFLCGPAQATLVVPAADPKVGPGGAASSETLRPAATPSGFSARSGRSRHRTRSRRLSVARLLPGGAACTARDRDLQTAAPASEPAARAKAALARLGGLGVSGSRGHGSHSGVRTRNTRPAALV